jgi:tRNA (guanine37-N1)-methyltransferase
MDQMMRIEIVTGFPKLVESPLNESIIRQAQKKGLIDIIVHDLRDYTHDRHKTIDDTPYGGGPGMILKPEPLFECVEAIRAARSVNEVILMSPEGTLLTQSLANELSLRESMVILCGHYKGVDDRVRQGLVTREVSIGDFVVSGGELPALVLVDALVRLIPGVLGDGESALKDSFQSGQLDHPHYTMKVPEVLLSGNHREIEAWREEKTRERTIERRKDLLQ